MSSIGFIGQEFAGQHHVHTVTLGIGFALNVHAEVDRAHDAVAKFFMDEFLDRGAINAHDLVPAVNQRVGRHRGRQRPLVGHHLQPFLFFSGQAEQLAQGFGLCGRGRHLPQAQRRGPLFGLTHFFGNRLPGHAFGHFGGDDFFRDVVAIHVTNLRFFHKINSPISIYYDDFEDFILSLFFETVTDEQEIFIVLWEMFLRSLDDNIVHYNLFDNLSRSFFAENKSDRYNIILENIEYLHSNNLEIYNKWKNCFLPFSKNYSYWLAEIVGRKHKLELISSWL